MNNLDIRLAIKDAKLRHWQVADFLQISEGALSRLLRHELTRKNKATILQAINQLKETTKNGR